jgi:hypothetical protein
MVEVREIAVVGPAPGGSAQMQNEEPIRDGSEAVQGRRRGSATTDAAREG